MGARVLLLNVRGSEANVQKTLQQVMNAALLTLNCEESVDSNGL